MSISVTATETFESTSIFRASSMRRGSRCERTRKQEFVATGIFTRFRTFTASHEVGYSKPSPEISLAGCRSEGKIPSQCVYVGDRLDADVDASALVGMRAIWLNRAHKTTPAANYISITSLLQLPEIIQTLETSGQP
jgi:FMN phosphatase YigB (HAD superfamily)